MKIVNYKAGEIVALKNSSINVKLFVVLEGNVFKVRLKVITKLILFRKVEQHLQRKELSMEIKIWRILQLQQPRSKFSYFKN